MMTVDGDIINNGGPEGRVGKILAALNANTMHSCLMLYHWCIHRILTLLVQLTQLLRALTKGCPASKAVSTPRAGHQSHGWGAEEIPIRKLDNAV
jgi:hypothetical protein